MKRKNLPAWQQVLLVALESVPKAKDGRDAWDKLNEEEKAAVMDFLAEHCGEDKAQDALEETCGKVKHGRGWQTTWGVLIGFGILAVICAALVWLGEQNNMFFAYLWIVMSLIHMIQAWNGDRHGRMQTIWLEHVDSLYGTTLALQDMYRTTDMPKELLRRKADLIFWGISTFVWIGLTVWKHLT